MSKFFLSTDSTADLYPEDVLISRADRDAVKIPYAGSDKKDNSGTEERLRGYSDRDTQASFKGCGI